MRAIAGSARFVGAAFLIALLGTFVAGSAAAPQQSAAPSVKTVWNGAYTDAQAKRGQADYDAHCASCHQADLSGYQSILKGSRFLEDYREASVYRLFDKIKSTMPRGSAGSLSDQSYIDIVSYVLKANDFPAGADELDAGRMPTILVTGKSGPTLAPNFSLVQVVGCLARREPDAPWMLVNATDPARAGHPQPTADEPLAEAARPLGSSTFTLIVSAAFDPAPHAGKKVEARGFLIRRAGDSRINLTSLQTIDSSCASPSPAEQGQRYLYVAVPGAENDAEHRGVSLVVFDIDHGHKLVKRIRLWPAQAEPESVRGVAASGARLYVSTTQRLAALDFATEKLAWEHDYGGHCCDRLAVSPDGRTIYAPAFGNPIWRVIDASSGAALSTIRVTGWPRHTVYAHDGRLAYLLAWESPVLSVADTASRTITREVGPFSGSLCAFAINRKEALAFANVDGLVGFEVGDLQTGLILDRVAVGDHAPEEIARLECPSHGIAFAPDERELWVADGVGHRLHVFDATMYPPIAKTTIALDRQPRWVTFGVDGRYAYASTGDVIDAASKKIAATLADEDGRVVESEHMLEVDFVAGRPVATSSSAR